MAPVALSMKSKGVDGIFMGTVPNTGFALAAALRLAGVKPKVFLLADAGYPGYAAMVLAPDSLIAKNPAAVKANRFVRLDTGSSSEAVFDRCAVA